MTAQEKKYNQEQALALARKIKKEQWFTAMRKKFGVKTNEEVSRAISQKLKADRTPEQRKAIASKAAKARWNRE